MRINGAPVGKPAASVAVGDVLTFAQARRIRVVRVLALGDRRGPATEAAGLFLDLAPDRPDEPASEGRPAPGLAPERDARRAARELRRGGLHR